MTDDSQLLWAYVRRADLDSFAALVKGHSKGLLAFLRGFFASESDVEDALQETWLRVIRSCGSYRGGSVRGYFLTVARSVAIDRYRRAGKPTVSLDAQDGDDAFSLLERADDAPAPDEVYEIRASAEEIRNEVRKLPLALRDVFLMRVEGELTFQEIANVLKIPLGTALTRMRQASQRLRRSLGKKEIGHV